MSGNNVIGGIYHGKAVLSGSPEFKDLQATQLVTNLLEDMEPCATAKILEDDKGESYINIKDFLQVIDAIFYANKNTLSFMHDLVIFLKSIEPNK